MSNKVRKLQGHDHFHRINYLYQVRISKYMAKNNKVLSAYYGNLIVNIAKKNVQKIHPEIKRQICKKCRCILIDSCSASTRIKTVKNVKRIVWTCKVCSTKKSLPVPKGRDHKVWLERPEAVQEVIDYDAVNRVIG